jgi:hypothetical protein
VTAINTGHQHHCAADFDVGAVWGSMPRRTRLIRAEFAGEHCGSGNFVEFSGGDVEDEAAYLVGVRDEGVGFDPLNRLA